MKINPHPPVHKLRNDRLDMLRKTIDNIAKIHEGTINTRSYHPIDESDAYVDNEIIITLTDNDMIMVDLTFTTRIMQDVATGYGYFSNYQRLEDSDALSYDERDIMSNIICLMEDLTNSNVPEIFYNYLNACEGYR